MKKKTLFKSKKVIRMLNESTWYWALAVLIVVFLRNSNSTTTDKPSMISLVLIRYNPLLACLLVPFIIFLIIKLIEFYLILYRTKDISPKGKSLLVWLIKHFHLSYKSDQIVLKDETTLLVFQSIFYMFGVLFELKWYLIGTIGMFCYLFLYITLSFRDLTSILKR